jgi:hypothetical protein
MYNQSLGDGRGEIALNPSLQKAPFERKRESCSLIHIERQRRQLDIETPKRRFHRGEFSMSALLSAALCGLSASSKAVGKGNSQLGSSSGIKPNKRHLLSPVIERIVYGATNELMPIAWIARGFPIQR